jgi:hypothetical protein
MIWRLRVNAEGNQLDPPEKTPAKIGENDLSALRQEHEENKQN